jgi:hypothetical protein
VQEALLVIHNLSPAAAIEPLESAHAFQGNPGDGANGIVVVDVHDAPQGDRHWRRDERSRDTGIPAKTWNSLICGQF